MEQTASTSILKSKKLLLKKNIVVKFISSHYSKKGCVNNSNIETSTLTIPTSIIRTNPF
jgi:hypothetical protein